MTASMQYLRAGDVDNYLAYMTKALAVAETSGDIARRNVLELALVYEDLMRLRYASAHARIERLKSEGLEGHPASLLRRLEADLKTARGEYARSRNILREGERQLAALQSGADRVTQAQLELACAAVENDLALGDLAGARADGKRCAASADPAFSIYALLASANTELLAGDMTTAREQLERARAAVLTMPDEPDRWSDTIRVASLLTRTGDAIGSDRLYNDVLPKLRHWGYSLLIAQAEIGLAENAAARGDWANASEHVAAARRGLPTDNWTLRYRLDVVDAAAASSKGDAARAVSIAAQAHGRAHQLGDLVAQMEIHTLMPHGSFPECGLASREAIIARSGMRGATTDWLKPSVDRAVASRK